VSAPLLIKSFVSVVLEEPHKVHYYYGRLLEEYNRNQSSELFSDADYPGIYFASHLLAAKTKDLLFKDVELQNWSYHISLMIKKLIAPELKKGSGFSDRKFLEMLARIEEKFMPAFELAVRTLRAQNIHGNQNRVPPVTSRLMSELFKSTDAAALLTVKTAPAKLKDGSFVGQVISIHPNLKTVEVKYGPYLIEALLKAGTSLKAGERIAFRIAKGIATIASG
jgi:hypothetical protein